MLGGGIHRNVPLPRYRFAIRRLCPFMEISQSTRRSSRKSPPIFPASTPPPYLARRLPLPRQSQYSRDIWEPRIAGAGTVRSSCCVSAGGGPDGARARLRGLTWWDDHPFVPSPRWRNPRGIPRERGRSATKQQQCSHRHGPTCGIPPGTGSFGGFAGVSGLNTGEPRHTTPPGPPRRMVRAGFCGCCAADFRELPRNRPAEWDGRRPLGAVQWFCVRSHTIDGTKPHAKLPASPPNPSLSGPMTTDPQRDDLSNDHASSLSRFPTDNW